MLTTAKADLQPHIVGVFEKLSKVCGRRICQVKRKAGQERIEQASLMGAQLLAFAAAEEGALDGVWFIAAVRMHNGRILDAAVCKTQPVIGAFSGKVDAGFPQKMRPRTYYQNAFLS
jgi:hypothetical protein